MRRRVGLSFWTKFLVGASVTLSVAWLKVSAEPDRAVDSLRDIELGVVDPVALCAERGGDVVAVDPDSAAGLRCALRRNGVFVTESLDLGAWCRDVFGAPARAERVETQGPTPWHCVRSTENGTT